MTVAVASSVVIRAATWFDAEPIHAMFREFVTSTQYRKYVGDSPEHSRAAIERMLSSDESRIFVAEDDNALIGMLGLFVFTQPFSGEVCASEAFWWLNPDRRGHGVHLLRRGEQWARTKGATRMDLMQPIDKPRVGQIYEALGYDQVEVVWRKTL